MFHYQGQLYTALGVKDLLRDVYEGCIIYNSPEESTTDSPILLIEH